MPSYLHTCYRIGDIDRSVAFYEKLGFEETWRMPIGDEAINVFMSLPGENPVLELTYNHGVDSYELGTGYNHIALALEDFEGTLERLSQEGIDAYRVPMIRRFKATSRRWGALLQDAAPMLGAPPRPPPAPLGPNWTRSGRGQGGAR